MKAQMLLLTLTMLVLGGCLVKPWAPTPSGTYSVEDRWAIVDAESLTVFVRPQIYTGNTQGVASNFFTLFVRIKNTSNRTVSLNRSSFGIIANQQQYDPVPLQIVLGSLPGAYLSSYYEDPFSTDQQAALNQSIESAREQYFELLNRYFSFGDILPGGMKEGYLFYNGAIERLESIEWTYWVSG